MKQLECIIFNVEHGFCAFIKSPNDYGLMIDCGGRQRFSPIKWVRSHYNFGKGNIAYHEGRRIAELIITHLHVDHFSDIGSLYFNKADKPKILQRDKQTLKFIDEKISEEKENNPRKELLVKFKKFQGQYNQDVEKQVDWGFDFFKRTQISYADAEAISSDRDKIINNRSYIIGIGYAGKKILIPGDIEEKAWGKAFHYESTREILANTNFFVASHHGRQSGCNSTVLKYTGKPDTYIISARARDDTFYEFYSREGNAKGYVMYGDTGPSRVISTKRQNQSIKIIIREDGHHGIIPIVTPDNLNPNQQKLIQKRTKRAVGGWQS